MPQHEPLSESYRSPVAVSTQRVPDRGPQTPEEPPLENEFDVRQYGRFLMRYWLLLAVCALAGAGVGFLQAMRKPTVYEAATTILATTQATPQVGIATSRALLENNTLAAQTLEETGLDKPPFNLTPQDFVGGALQIEEVRGTNLMRVKVRLGDPRKAAEASVILSRKAVELNRRIADAGSVAVRDQLAEHLDGASERLRQAEQQLLEYRKDAQVEIVEKDTEAMLYDRSALWTLVVDIEVEKSRLAAAEQEIQKHQPVVPAPRAVHSEEALRHAAQAAAGEETTSPPVVANPDSLDLSNPFVNPVYQTLALQIATSRTRLAGLERQRREMETVRRLNADRIPKLAELYQRELRLAKLQADYDLAKRVRADLALRYEQSRTESVSRMTQLQVIDEAIPADRPLPKKRVQSTALGLTVGLLLGILIALVRDSMWTSAVARRA